MLFLHKSGLSEKGHAELIYGKYKRKSFVKTVLVFQTP